VLKLVQRGPTKIGDIVEQLYGSDDLPDPLVEAAGWQVHAHLLKLRSEGKVEGSSSRSAWKAA
jgi:hypothetical protein